MNAADRADHGIIQPTVHRRNDVEYADMRTARNHRQAVAPANRKANFVVKRIGSFIGAAHKFFRDRLERIFPLEFPDQIHVLGNVEPIVAHNLSNAPTVEIVSSETRAAIFITVVGNRKFLRPKISAGVEDFRLDGHRAIAARVVVMRMTQHNKIDRRKIKPEPPRVAPRHFRLPAVEYKFCRRRFNQQRQPALTFERRALGLCVFEQDGQLNH